MTERSVTQPEPTPPQRTQCDLHDDERALARAAATRFATADLTLPELLLEAERWERHIAVLETYPRGGDGGDLAASGIAYAEERINELARSISRLLVAKGGRFGRASRETLAPDFDRARYADVVGLAETLGYEVRKTGKNYVMRCPWHGGGLEQTPSLVIYPPGLGWHCFGCGRGGRDAAAFAAEHFVCSQLDGLRWVEQLCDVPGAGQ